MKTDLTEFYRLQRDVLMAAIMDSRLHRRHLRVLSIIVERCHPYTGFATVGRKILAELTGYTVNGVGKTVSELIAAGYLTSERWALEPGQHAVAHHRVVLPKSVEAI